MIDLNAITIRPATKKDIPDIFNLVQQLAEYEKEPESVTTDVPYYEQAFENQLFSASVATYEGEVVAMTLFYDTFSTWRGRMLYLEDFIVKEAFRKSGIGQLLFDDFIQIAKKRQCTMVKWQVLDWNEPAINFYIKNNATIEKEWWNGKIIL